jgi:Plasmid encoded RepA protein
LRRAAPFGNRCDMAEVHQLILQYGIEEARRQAGSKHERQVIEAAYQVLSDESERIGYTYSGFALTSLPHKPQKELVWKREGHNLTMLIESGRDRTGAPLGVPYGSYARFILLFLQSEAIRTQSREVELGRSMRVWLGTMGLSIGGKTYKQVNEQARRISGCSLTFFADRAGAQIKSRGGFVKTEITMAAIDEQPALWQDRVILDEDFYRALRDHPVPVSDAALRAIGPRSLVIDIYVWLAYRLHALRRDVEISWTALHVQFGAEVGRLRGFRKYFIECLALATAAYPEARVDLGDRGLILRPSRPAIARAS